MSIFGFPVQSEVFSIILVTLILCVLIYFANRSIRKSSQYESPSGILGLVLIYHNFIRKLTSDNMGGNKVAENYVPYIGSLVLYLFVSNIIGLFAIQSPTSNFSVTLTLTLISWVLIQRTKIKTNGVMGFIKSFFEPMPLFFILNFFSLIAPLISMSLRLFGNVLSGSIILELFYQFTGWASQGIPFIGFFNVFGTVTAPVLHAYFDLFSGFIQMYIFVTLTTVFIGSELAEE